MCSASGRQTTLTLKKKQWSHIAALVFGSTAVFCFCPLICAHATPKHTHKRKQVRQRDAQRGGRAGARSAHRNEADGVRSAARVLALQLARLEHLRGPLVSAEGRGSRGSERAVRTCTRTEKVLGSPVHTSGGAAAAHSTSSVSKSLLVRAGSGMRRQGRQCRNACMCEPFSPTRARADRRLEPARGTARSTARHGPGG
jgi:hypothetical protein